MKHETLRDEFYDKYVNEIFVFQGDKIKQSKNKESKSAR